MTPYQEFRRLRALARADRLLGFPRVAEKMEEAATHWAVKVACPSPSKSPSSPYAPTLH